MNVERGRTAIWLASLVVLAAAVPYLSSINDYFTQDDFGVIQLLSNRPWSTFPKWFTMPWMEDIWAYTPDEIRPFVALSYQITSIPGRARPELHHALNIAIHAANALLVMASARRAFGLSLKAAGFAGIVFALLPLQAESVAWITGRVDSMPAFFYLATFVCYVQWRYSRERRGRWYAAALALFFVALFSKQNTITMVASLALFDLFVVDRARRGSLSACVRAWLPFAAMTLAYLGLRRALFGASVRGGVDSSYELLMAARMIGRHVLRTTLGHTNALSGWEWAAAIWIVLTLAVWLAANRRFIRPALALGIGWWLVGVAPVLVAGYESPRHVYLAAAGWAMLMGLFIEPYLSLAQGSNRALRAVPLVAAVVICASYGGRLYRAVGEWNAWARVSEIAVHRVAEEAAAAPPGTLLLVSVPQKSWEWSTPFVLQPPYAPEDLSARVRLVTPFRLHCCGGDHWDGYTRRTLAAWRDDPARPSIVALHFAADTGKVSRVTEAENPALRQLLGVVLTTDSWVTLNGSIVNVMERLVRK